MPDSAVMMDTTRRMMAPGQNELPLAATSAVAISGTKPEMRRRYWR